MSLESIEKLIADVIVGGTMCSLKVSGELLEIEFTAKGIAGIRDFVISTGAPVFLREIDEEDPERDLARIDFIGSRREIIPKLYELTGQDINSVSLSSSLSLEISLVNSFVLVCPRQVDVGQRAYYEEWRIITSDEKGNPCWLVQVEGGELFVNQRHPLLLQ